MIAPLCAVVGLSVGVAPANADASQALGTQGEEASWHLLAGNASGRAIAIWTDPHRHLRFAVAAPGGPFGRSGTLGEASGQSSASVAMNPRGESLVAWAENDHRYPPPESRVGALQCCDQVRVAVLNRVGSIVATTTLNPTTTTAIDPQATIAPDGSAAVTYDEAPVEEEVSPFAFTERLRTSTADHEYSPAVEVPGSVIGLQARARQVSVITRVDGSTLVESSYGVGGAMRSTRSLGSAPEEQFPTPLQVPFEAAFDSVGGVGVLGPTEAELEPFLLVTLRDPHTALRRNRVDLTPSRRFTSQSLAVAPSGRFLIARMVEGAPWRDGRIGVADGVLGGVRPRTTAVLHPFASEDAIESDSPSMAVDSSGRAAIAFQLMRAHAGYLYSSVLMTRSATGRWSKLRHLSAWRESNDAAEPRLVLDAHGGGVVIWEEPSRALRASRFRATGY